MTTRDSANPSLSFWVLLLFLPVVLVLCVGIGLWAVPWLIAPRWLWELTPFNARFLGAIYLTELSVGILFLFRNRRSPGRVVLPSALAFVALISIISLLYLDHFNLQRRATLLWFVVYLIPLLLLILILLTYRRLLASVPSKPPFPWPNLLLIESVLFFVYALCLLVAPATATSFWPWPVDAFHARLYSAFFFSFGVGALVISQGAARLDLLASGLAQTIAGIAVLIGFVVTDFTVHRVHWLSGDTWMWLGMFVAMTLTGLLLIGVSYDVALFREASSEDLSTSPQPRQPGPMMD